MATTITGVKKAYVDKLLGEATVKTQIDFDGTNFKIDGRVLNYKELHDVHIIKPDFAFVVYGDRAYLLSYVQDGTNAMRELRFQSTIAVTNAESLSYVKTSGIYVTSSDGINIASVRIADVNSENEGYKADAINESNKNSTVWYPSNKAVTEQITAIKEDFLQSVGGKGWTSEQINLLDEIGNHLRFSTDEGGQLWDRLIASLRNGASEDTPIYNPISVSYSGTIATINNLKNLTVGYSGTVATIGA